MILLPHRCSFISNTGCFVNVHTPMLTPNNVSVTLRSDEKGGTFLEILNSVHE